MTASFNLRVQINMLPHTVETTNQKAIASPDLWIAGLGSQYPPYTLATEKLDKFASRFYDTQSPGYR